MQWAVTKIDAMLCFINDWMIQLLCIVMTEHVLTQSTVPYCLLEQLYAWVISEGVLQVRVSSHVRYMVELTGIIVMLIIKITLCRFEVD